MEKIIFGILLIMTVILLIMAVSIVGVLFYLFILPFFVKFEDVEAEVRTKHYEESRTEVSTILINGTVMPTVKAIPARHVLTMSDGKKIYEESIDVESYNKINVGDKIKLSVSKYGHVKFR